MKQIRLLAFLLALVLLASSFFGCQSSKDPTVIDPTQTEPTPEPEPEQPAEPEIEVVYELTVRNDNPHTEMQNEYLKSKNGYKTLTDEMTGKGEKSKPVPIALKWATTKVVGGKLNRVETAVISEDEAFTNPIRIDSENRRVELINLEIGKTFYWYVEGKIGSTVVKSDVATFTVADAGPRNLDVGGVTNCRDLGGWKTEDGKTTLRQGQLFRSANFNNVTSEGKKVLLNDLGIKTEIELRMAEGKGSAYSTTESILGSSVKLVFAPMDDSVSNLLSSSVNADSLLKVFETLGDENNYPIIFHCNIGTDRTGMIAFLVLGLCGVSERDIYRDYLFSNFASLGSSRSGSVIEKYLDTIKSAEGKTLSEKIENYLLSRGVKAEQIATIKKMMK